MYLDIEIMIDRWYKTFLPCLFQVLPEGQTFKKDLDFSIYLPLSLGSEKKQKAYVK
jgi:hypothetical protein